MHSVEGRECDIVGLQCDSEGNGYYVFPNFELLHGIRLTQLGFLAHDSAAKSLFSSRRAKVAESRTCNQLRELG